MTAPDLRVVADHRVLTGWVCRFDKPVLAHFAAPGADEPVTVCGEPMAGDEPWIPWPDPEPEECCAGCEHGADDGEQMALGG